MSGCAWGVGCGGRDSSATMKVTDGGIVGRLFADIPPRFFVFLFVRLFFVVVSWGDNSTGVEGV